MPRSMQALNQMGHPPQRIDPNRRVQSRVGDKEIVGAVAVAKPPGNGQLLPFQCFERRFYDVEVSFKKKGDVIYHFFPKRGQLSFTFGHRIFGMLLEDAVIKLLGKNVEAEADYLNREDAQHFMRANDPTRALGQPTFWMKLVGLGNRLGAQRILIDGILTKLDNLLERASHEMLGELDEQVFLRRLRDSRWR